MACRWRGLRGAGWLQRLAAEGEGGDEGGFLDDLWAGARVDSLRGLAHRFRGGARVGIGQRLLLTAVSWRGGHLWDWTTPSGSRFYWACGPGVALDDSLDPRLLAVEAFGLRKWVVQRAFAGLPQQPT